MRSGWVSPYPYPHKDLIYKSDITHKSRIYNISITTTGVLTILDIMYYEWLIKVADVHHTLLECV